MPVTILQESNGIVSFFIYNRVFNPRLSFVSIFFVQDNRKTGELNGYLSVTARKKHC
jgi:hypothetical protein